jgi:AraC-like DNA-binding protein
VDDVDLVRAWRQPDHPRLLWMRGVTTHYRTDPVGEFIIGVTTGRSYNLRRGRSLEVVRPGELVVLDPSAPHSGSPAEGGPWAGRLLVIELGDLNQETFGARHLPFDVEFPEALVDDRRLARQFASLHRMMEAPASRLERQAAFSAFLHELAQRSPAAGRTRTRTADESAMQRAREFLHDNVARNVSLDELAAVAGTSKYHLVRHFRAAFGLPPHSLQISERVIRARALLERGIGVAEVAAGLGFVDQSHLHRHFTRRLGMTPARYARAFSASQAANRPRTIV